VNTNLSIELDAVDEAAFNGLADVDKSAFIIAKLAATLAPKLLPSLGRGAVIAALKPEDQQAIAALFTAIKAMP
jgi:hypothetical protein